MSVLRRIQRFRDWVPVPGLDGRVRLGRWLLLDGNRVAVAGALTTFVYISLLAVGIVWPFEMLDLLTETRTVENILQTFLSGIILLVSIVVSINSIVLSQDMTSIDKQESRIRGVGDFWRDIDEATGVEESPSDLRTFLEVLTETIREQTDQVADVSGEFERDLREEVTEYTDSVTESLAHLDEIERAHGADFSLLWTALEIDYGPLLDRTHVLRSRSGGSHPDSYNSALDDLTETFQLFAVGREYFKTLYYTTEVSRLSRVLLVVSLPTIIVTASAILAISAGVFPDYWVLGLPPLNSFVATMFTVALIPYIILTSFMLRLSTVAKRTDAAGVFSI